MVGSYTLYLAEAFDALAVRAGRMVELPLPLISQTLHALDAGWSRLWRQLERGYFFRRAR
jgi:hypothetical protein